MNNVFMCLACLHYRFIMFFLSFLLLRSSGASDSLCLADNRGFKTAIDPSEQARLPTASKTSSVGVVAQNMAKNFVSK